MHKLGPLPWSLASFEGSFAKTNIAALPKLVDDGVDNLQHLPAQTSAVILDAMAILQMLSKIPNRFSDLAEMVFNRILLQAGETKTVDFVDDHQYPEISIKKHREREEVVVANYPSTSLARNSCAHGNGKNLCPPVAIKRVC